MKKTTREWVRKAEADLRAAHLLFRGKESLHDQSCFLCQQSAEKHLKALLEERGLTIPRTHILKDLLVLLSSHYPSLGKLRVGLTFLSRFAVGTRYPGDKANKRQATSAQRWAAKVRALCRGALGLRPLPMPRKKQ